MAPPPLVQHELIRIAAWLVAPRAPHAPHPGAPSVLDAAAMAFFHGKHLRMPNGPVSALDARP